MELITTEYTEFAKKSCSEGRPLPSLLFTFVLLCWNAQAGSLQPVIYRVRYMMSELDAFNDPFCHGAHHLHLLRFIMKFVVQALPGFEGDITGDQAHEFH